MSNVNLIWCTPNIENTLAYIARVSNPNNQNNKSYRKLFKYCYDNNHWSVFETVNICVEIETTRAIARQLLRHRSFTFQEFSQRYAEIQDFETVNPRSQDSKNRQSSHDNLPKDIKDWFRTRFFNMVKLNIQTYKEFLDQGISKESARFILPESILTKLYMNGTVRSWIHYLLVRTDESTQKEHRDIALMIENVLYDQIPYIIELIREERKKLPLLTQLKKMNFEELLKVVNNENK